MAASTPEAGVAIALVNAEVVDFILEYLNGLEEFVRLSSESSPTPVHSEPLERFPFSPLLFTAISRRNNENGR